MPAESNSDRNEKSSDESSSESLDFSVFSVLGGSSVWATAGRAVTAVRTPANVMKTTIRPSGIRIAVSISNR